MWRRSQQLLRHGPRATAGHRGFFFQRKPQGRLFDIEGLSEPKDFPRLAADAVSAAKQGLAAAPSLPPAQLVQALDSASNGLCRIADAAELCRNVHPDQEFVAKASDAVQEIAAYMGEVNLDSAVYDGMLRAEEGPEFQAMDLEGRTVLHHMRVAMEHEGIHLPREEKEECLQLLEQEQVLSFDIVQSQEQLGRTEVGGIWLPVEGVQDSLGAHVRQLQKRKAGSVEEVLVPSDGPVAHQILKTASCEATRRSLREAQNWSVDQGEEDMAELLRVRQRLARMRGYETWAEYAQREGLLSSPDRVGSFLEQAWERLQPGLMSDLELMSAEKERLGLGGRKVEAWDVPLLLHTCRQRYEPGSRKVSEYLTYGSLMKGVDLILSKLLGLSFVAETPGEGEVWHSSVQKFSLREGDRVLGILYLDPFVRPGKVVSSAQFTLQGSKLLQDGSTQIPATTLVYSLPSGTVGLPMAYAVTFMHEIGHAVHSLLSETKFQHLSGTRGNVDFVEFPSHLFEHFVLDPECLASYASHGQTGAPMPADVRRSALTSRRSFAHFEAAQQLMYAVVDQAFYSYVPLEGPGAAAGLHGHLQSVLDRYDSEAEGRFGGRVTPLLGLSKPAKFDHLVHYGGSYHCYLFNRALSAHVWDSSFAADPFGATQGGRLRDLFRGGSVVPSLESIEALCPGAGGFKAEDVPLDALVAQLSPAAGA